MLRVPVCGVVGTFCGPFGSPPPHVGCGPESSRAPPNQRVGEAVGSSHSLVTTKCASPTKFPVLRSVATSL